MSAEQLDFRRAQEYNTNMQMRDIGGLLMVTLSKGNEHLVPSRESKNYNGVDLVKFLCAIMVFIIHIPPFKGEVLGLAKYVNFGLQHFVCRIAVPFYFVSSGFFLFKKMPRYKLDKEIILSYCFRILRLLGTWHVLLFIGGTGHLWYLGATVIAIILLSLCLHFRIRLGCIYAIACVLYVIGLLGDSYYGVIAPLENITIFRLIFKGYALAFSTTRNGVFMGFIFILMGATLANCSVRLKIRAALIGFAVSMLFLFGEVFLLEYNDIPIEHNMYVFLLPATFFLFVVAVSTEIKDRPIYKHLRNIGIVIYFSHMLINKVMALGLGVVEKYCCIEITQYQFFFSLLFNLLFAIFTEWLSHKNRFKWVNWFIS